MKKPQSKESWARAARLLLLAACCPGWACSPAYPPPPETRQEVVVDTLHGVEFPDPFRWLEDQQSQETRSWIERQNAYAEEIIGQSPLRERVRQRLEELMDVDGFSSPRKAGDFEYFTMRRKGQELPVLYRRDAPAEGTRLRIDPAEEYEVVIDPHGMSTDHTTRVAIHSFSDDGKYLIYSLRDGGQDEVELRIRDLEKGSDLPERYPNALYGMSSFSSDGKGFYFVPRSRYAGPRLYYHILGTPIEEDQEIFGNGIGPTSFLRLTQAEEDRFHFFTVQHGWAGHEIYFRDTQSDETKPIVAGLKAHFQARFRDGKLLLRTDFKAPNYRILEIDPKKPGQEDWKEVLAEGSDVLQSYSLIGERIYARYLHNVSNKIRIFKLDGTPDGEIPVPDHHTASIRGFGKGKALLSLGSLTMPQTDYLLDLESGEREVWKDPGIEWDSQDYTVQQVWYATKDGTQVPMYLVHKTGIELDGSHPALLYGYGGFNVSLTPRFSARTAVWLENGGIWAVANLRGGSEFGEEWHRGGMLENKQNVFDDFIAAAQWLIDQGYTSSAKLAIYGRSNGGLLVASALTQRPELFRAVLCAFPDLDMVRFFTFTETNNMPALLEYGNAKQPAQFEYLRLYSPYQNVFDGTDYPAVMLTSGDLDTRVPPLQARKMTAILQASTSSGLPVILRYSPKAGHAAGRGRPFSKSVQDTAAELAFLLGQLGVGADNAQP